MYVINANRERILSIFPSSGTAAEIGTHRGDFAALLLNETGCVSLHLIDCWENQDNTPYQRDTLNVSSEHHQANYGYVLDRFKDEILARRVTVHRAFSTDAAATFPDSHFDWIYIDGNHTYEAVTEDLELYLPKVKEDGLICGHDYTNSVWALARGFGVVEAVNDFAKEKDLEMIFLTREIWPTFGLSRKKAAQAWKKRVADRFNDLYDAPTAIPEDFKLVLKIPGLFRRFLNRMGVTAPQPVDFYFKIHGRAL